MRNDLVVEVGLGIRYSGFGSKEMCDGDSDSGGAEVLCGCGRL